MGKVSWLYLWAVLLLLGVMVCLTEIIVGDQQDGVLGRREGRTPQETLRKLPFTTFGMNLSNTNPPQVLGENHNKEKNELRNNKTRLEDNLIASKPETPKTAPGKWKEVNNTESEGEDSDSNSYQEDEIEPHDYGYSTIEETFHTEKRIN